MKLSVLIEQIDDSYYLNNFQHELKDFEIADYIETYHPDGVENEVVYEYFRGMKGVLKKVPIDTIKEGPPDNNLRNEKKEKRYLKSKTPYPPIVIWLGMIEDGHHRWRNEKLKGSQYMWVYDVIDDPSE